MGVNNRKTCKMKLSKISFSVAYCRSESIDKVHISKIMTSKLTCILTVDIYCNAMQSFGSFISFSSIVMTHYWKAAKYHITTEHSYCTLQKFHN